MDCNGRDININININIPEDVKGIMKAFNKGGYEIFAVGGCVRDSILGRAVNDWDLCTKATPGQILEICSAEGFKYIPTGLKHGTITVVLNSENYEITTYRLDGDYSDGRHPDEVQFTTSLREDLARRDFTINALAYNDEEKLVDYFGGIEDLARYIIRCVGKPEERFREDNLRRLRAVRFAAQLGFKIEEEAYRQLSLNQDSLRLLSVERIREELNKILMSDNASYGIRELMELGMLKYIIPELERCKGFDQKTRYHDKDVFEHTLSVVDNTPPILNLRLSALLHDIAKPPCFFLDDRGQGHFPGHDLQGADMSEKILKRLKYDNKTIEKVVILVRYHMDRFEKIRIPAIKRFINRVGIENLEDLFKLQTADIKGSARKYQNYDVVNWLREKCRQVITEKHPLTTRDLKIDGRDLMALGFKQGPELGNALSYLLGKVLERPDLNTREQLVELLKTDYRERAVKE